MGITSEYLRDNVEIKGPARRKTQKVPSYIPGLKLCMDFKTDFVPALRCFTWPPVASEWITRSRKHGWPDARTISLVIEGGCHIVPVAHNDCGEDEFQWRISFSRAEVVLMKTASRPQQYIHHMLRYFAKKELMHPDWKTSDQVITTYISENLDVVEIRKRIYGVLADEELN